MSKIEKLREELFMVLSEDHPTLFIDTEKVNEILKRHLRDVHDEAVAATVMASNKKQFVKPEFSND